MIGMALCPEPPGFIGTVKLGKWALGTSDRRWQDKARKVRTVGRDEL